MSAGCPRQAATLPGMSNLTAVQRQELRRITVGLLPGTRTGAVRWELDSMGELSARSTTLADGRKVKVAFNGLGTHVEISKGLTDTGAWFPHDRDINRVRRAAFRQVRLRDRAEKPARDAADRARRAREAADLATREKESARDLLGG